jgi:tungstate transport system permease protein
LNFLFEGISAAFGLIFSLDAEFLGIVWVSVKVSSMALGLGALTGVPLGLYLACRAFPGRGVVLSIINTLMGVPTVVVGLTFYSILSRQGPLGGLGLLYTQTAMVLGQWALAIPIITGLTWAAVSGLDKRVTPTILTLGVGPWRALGLYLLEARVGIMAALTMAFARIFAEIGVAMMLGGNIRAYTRNITTAIALETGRGEFALAMALGLVLLIISLGLNVSLHRLRAEHQS